MSAVREKLTDEQLIGLEQLAREHCAPGESIQVHADECPIDEDEGECACDPLTITVPEAQA